MASRTRPSLRLSCTGVQRSSLAIIARARRGEPGDEATCTIHVLYVLYELHVYIHACTCIYMYIHVYTCIYMYNFIDCTVAHFILQHCSLVPHVRITNLHVYMYMYIIIVNTLYLGLGLSLGNIHV